MENNKKKLVNQPGKVLVGYWHNWKSGGGDGYKGGTSAAVKLSETPKDYNVICVSFMKSGWNGGIPTFAPDGMTDAQFRAEVDKLNAEGRSVLIALGGADAHIELKSAEEDAFVAEIIRLVDVYGFDGLDIDLEQSAIIAGDNQLVIPSALKKVKDYFRTQGENFMITMAPEFPYLRTGGHYSAYISRLEGYYDYINPQYYNQAGDGITSEDGQWIAQNNDALKEKFLYSLTKAIVTGTNGYLKIPANKFVIGLPANNDGAANGYVIDPKAVSNAMASLKKDGLEIKGLMTWSINWDGGKTSAGVSYNWGFVKTYGPMLFGNTEPEVPDTVAPTVPANLKATSVTKDTVSLSWSPSTDNVGVVGYIVFRNNVQVGSTTTTNFVDPDLKSNTSYTYSVKAFDKASNLSAASTTINVKTDEDTPEVSKPNAPTNLHTTNVSDKSVSLAWSSNNVNCTYLIYRQSNFRTFDMIGRTTTLAFTDSSVKPSSNYSYFVVCEDNLGNVSPASNTIAVKTGSEPETGGGDVPEWISDKVYDKGDHVMYEGQEYEAQHWVQYTVPGTNPDAWKKIGGENVIAEWNKETIYVYPDMVTYQGSLYRAKYWTKGDVPGAEVYGPWEKMS